MLPATRKLAEAVDHLEEAQLWLAEAEARLRLVLDNPKATDEERVDALSLALDRAKQVQLARDILECARLAARNSWAAIHG